MAVLIIAVVDGQTVEGYDGMFTTLAPALRGANGFLAHGAGPTRDGWRTFEVWESLADATQFFAAHIRPNLPPGVKPARTIVELHNLEFAAAVTSGTPLRHAPGASDTVVPQPGRG
jgi:hypothetical protein